MEIKHYNWSDFAFKKDLPFEKPYVFISGSRNLSFTRVLDIFKNNISLGNIVWGIYEEECIDGFSGQIQFETLKTETIKQLESKLTNAKLPRSIYFVKYSQKDSPFLIEKLRPIKSIFINGSWLGVFHRSNAFYKLHSKEIKYELISPFVDENEAKEYYQKLLPELDKLSNIGKNVNGKKLSENEIFELVDKVSKRSFDYTFQIGEVLTKNRIPILTAWNKCIPYETYAMHFGSLREKYFSPPGDLNNYDTLHSEIDIILQAQMKRIDLKGTSLYINLLPCPTCAKAVGSSDIKKIYYKLDHSEGYAYKLLKEMGKECIRI